MEPLGGTLTAQDEEKTAVVGVSLVGTGEEKKGPEGKADKRCQIARTCTVVVPPTLKLALTTAPYSMLGSLQFRFLPHVVKTGSLASWYLSIYLSDEYLSTVFVMRNVGSYTYVDRDTFTLFFSHYIYTYIYTHTEYVSDFSNAC